MKERLEWEYKDGSRYWWLITAYKENEIKSFPDDFDDDSVDWIWGYHIERDKVIVYGDQLRGQYDIAPHPEEFFAEYLNYLNRVHAGLAKHAVERTPDNE